MDSFEIGLRLLVATIAGTAIGLNRDLHEKPTGVRTLGLVGLASALIVFAFEDGEIADQSRVVQGIVTGIGFLGAGVILRGQGDKGIRGLTTAACVWLTACIGAACAIADWAILAMSGLLVFMILLFGGPFEKAIHRQWRQSGPEPADED
jgi:putative Mg2+ transporter-C (MgtC) family protein